MKKATNLLAAALLAAAPLSAQDTKGAHPINQSTNQPVNQTRAVVVGISDYQDPAIPDLRFAHRDAEAFANWLRSPAGGALDGNHLKLLTNNQATTGKFVAALDWLLEQSQEGDMAIIYFSGHGDVEMKTRNQLGFLLTWDAPAQAYMAGAYPIFFLQTIIESISLEKKARVLLVTDACHAGKLAGRNIGGSGLTTAELSRQFANEIKILSCQPNEFSIEGDQWGGGRGAFSFHLVDGLLGLADRNADSGVTLSEMDRYLEDRVAVEVAPHIQTPMVVGDKNARLAQVFPEILAEMQRNKAGQMTIFSKTESRALEDIVLAEVDAGTRNLYYLFKKALDDKVFFEPATSGNFGSADDYYKKLITDSTLATLHQSMRRNFAAALQDDAQQVLNRWLKTDIMELSKSKKTQVASYDQYPKQLERAAELLGSKHYMFATLQARKAFFEGYLKALSNQNPDRITGAAAMANYQKSLQWLPDQPFVYWQMSQVFALHLQEPDSAITYANKAVENAPQWVLPLTDLSFLFCERLNMVERAAPLMESARRIDSSSVVVWTFLGVYYLRTGQFDQSEKLLLQAVNTTDADICYPCANIALGALYAIMGRMGLALQFTEKALAMDSTNLMACSNLGLIYTSLGRLDDAERILLYSIRLDSTETGPYWGLARLYIGQKRDAEAEQIIRVGQTFQPDSPYLYLMLAALRSHQGALDEAFELLESGLKKGFNNNFDFLQQDPVMARLKQEVQRWDALMKKYPSKD